MADPARAPGSRHGPPGLASSTATPPMPAACQSSSSAGPSRRASRIAPGGTCGAAGRRPARPAAVPQVLQVGQPLAQIGIGDAAHAVVQLAGDPLHRRLGGQPAADHLGHPFQPAGVGRNQAIGFEHVARCRYFRAAGQIVRHAGDQLVETLLHALRRIVQAREFGLAGRRPAAAPGGGGSRAARPGRWRCPGTSVEPAKTRGIVAPTPSSGAVGGAGRRQDLGEQHRHGLQLVHLIVGVAARIAVLHRDHAQRPSGPPHRHGQHGGERFLAGLGAVGEGRVVLRIRQVHHLTGGGAQPDDALADAQPRAADGQRVEAFGGGQLQDLAWAGA